MAVKKGWCNMPFDELADALNAKTHTRVMRVDRPLPAALSADGVETPLFFELTV